MQYDYIIFYIRYVNLRMDIVKSIVAIRESKGLKQSEIASKMDIDQPNYSRLEKRGEKLSVEQLRAIANALEVSLNEILNLETPSEKEKLKELEKRNEELETAVKNNQSIIDSYEFDIDMLLEGLGSEILNFFSASKSGGTISQLYKLQDQSPYCELVRNDNSRRLINGYLNFKSKESEFLRSFYQSELFDMEDLFQAMDNYNFVANNKENISIIVSEQLDNEWNEMVKEQERIDNNPKTQRRIESMRAYRKELDD